MKHLLSDHIFILLFTVIGIIKESFMPSFRVVVKE